MRLEHIEKAQELITEIVDLNAEMATQIAEINKLLADYADFMLECIKELRDGNDIK